MTQMDRRPTYFRLWLVGTLVFVLAMAAFFRPDRDAAWYLEHRRAEADGADIAARQLVAHIRLLHTNRLTSDEIVSRLAINGALTGGDPAAVIALEAALRKEKEAERRLARFATVALLPPLIILELGAALLWTRRRVRKRTGFADAVSGPGPASGETRAGCNTGADPQAKFQ